MLLENCENTVPEKNKKSQNKTPLIPVDFMSGKAKGYRTAIPFSVNFIPDWE